MNAPTIADHSGCGRDGPRGAWNRFWFRPTDPTTIGFIRIVAGLLVVYVHLSYCFDLEAFFGPRGYLDQKTVNQFRRESPVRLTPFNWDEPKPENRLPEPKILPPIQIERRQAVFGLLRFLHEDTKKSAEAREYIYFLLEQIDKLAPFPNRDQDFKDGLGMIKDSSTLSEQDRAQMAAEFEKPKVGRNLPLSNLPEFMRALPPAARVQLWNQSQALARQFASKPDAPNLNWKYIAEWAKDMNGQDRGDVASFLKGLPSGQEGRRVLDYYELWNEDPRKVYAVGLDTFSLWFHISNPATIWACHAIILLIFVLFTVGFCTRVTSVMTWLAALFYIHRNQNIMFGQDTMMNVALFYLMIGPSGAALSVDRLIARYRASRAILKAGNQRVPWAEAVLAGPQPSSLANFAIRLLQIHFCFIYMASGLAKLKGSSWWNNEATWLTIANAEFTPMNYWGYEWLLLQIGIRKPILEMVFGFEAYFTLVLEITLPFLIWTRIRPVMVCGAVLLHSGICWIMGLTCFGMFMMTLLLCFVPASVIRPWVSWPKGSGRRLTLRFSSLGPKQMRLAAMLQASDLAGQLTLQDEASKNPKQTAELVDDTGQVFTGFAIVEQSARTIRLMRLFRWALWIPGIGLLLRRALIP
jgi:hypothetical protein